MKALGVFLIMVAPLAAEIAAVTHPEESFPATRTVLWTPLFQAAWDRLNQHHGGPPSKVEPPNPRIERLDGFKWESAKVLPPAGWKTWAGPATSAFLAEVNREATAMSGDPEPAFSLAEEDPDAVAIFALLERQVVFEKAFLRSGAPLHFRAPAGGTEVRFFGVKDDSSGEFAATVKVLAYRPGEKCHALELACRGGSESLVLFRPPGAQDFATACHWLRTWKKKWKADGDLALHYNDPRLHRLDEVRIPYLKMDAETDFTGRLAGLRFYKNQPGPREIGRALQEVEFELHERGARVKAKVSLADPFGGGPEAQPVFARNFSYDSPFFVFLWRDGAEWPYFGAWVGDASAMERWE